MARKSGRVRCGVCRKVLEDRFDGRRQPRHYEQTELDAMPPSSAKGRKLYRYMRPRTDLHDYSWSDDGVISFFCPSPCSTAYQPSNFVSRLYDARDRAEDFFLLPSDRSGQDTP